MKVAVIHNRDASQVLNVFGMQNRETYNPKTVERIATSLENGGHNVRVVDGNMHVIEELGTFMPRVIAGDRPGMVFNMAYGIQGQARYTHVPSFLEMLGVPYVGSSPAGHAVALDKVMSKVVFLHAGLPTAPFRVYNSPDECDDAIGWPVIVKPKMEAVSFGLKIVDNLDDLREAVAYVVGEFKQQALVERFIAGREFAVGLLGNGDDLEVLPIVEIDLEGDPNAIQTVTDKRKKPRGKICPAVLSDEAAEELRRLARGAFNALGLHDFSRVDFRMDADGNPWILEINSMASLGPTGTYVHSAGVAGYDYEKLVNRMLDVAVIRYFGKEALASTAAEPAAPATEKRVQPLSTRVRQHCRTNLPSTIETLRQMVEIDSHASNVASINRLGRLLATQLTPLGFHLQVHPQIEVGDVLTFSNHTEARSDVLVLGHLDTASDIRDYTPWGQERAKLIGTGVAENKGGLAVMIAALQALRSARSLRKVRCRVLLVTDATSGSRASRKLIEEAASDADYVLGLGPAGADGALINSCSGSMQFRVEISNRKRAGEIAPNVVSGLAARINAWTKLTSDADGIRVVPLAVEGRTMPGRVPDHATATIRVRYPTDAQGTDIEAQVRKIGEKGTSADLLVNLRKGSQRPPLVPTAAIAAFVERVTAVAKRLEVRAPVAHRDEPSVISFATAAGAALDGLGPVRNETGTSEAIVTDSLVDRSALLAMIMRECTGERA